MVLYNVGIAKYIEIKTQKSIRSVIKELKKVTDAKIYDNVNNREIIMRSKMSDRYATYMYIIKSNSFIAKLHIHLAPGLFF